MRGRCGKHEIMAFRWPHICVLFSAVLAGTGLNWTVSTQGRDWWWKQLLAFSAFGQLVSLLLYGVQISFYEQKVKWRGYTIPNNKLINSSFGRVELNCYTVKEEMFGLLLVKYRPLWMVNMLVWIKLFILIYKTRVGN